MGGCQRLERFRGTGEGLTRRHGDTEGRQVSRNGATRATNGRDGATELHGQRRSQIVWARGKKCLWLQRKSKSQFMPNVFLDGKPFTTVDFNTMVKQHRAGWHVVESGRRLLSLKFSGIDPPAYIFEIVDADCPQQQIQETLNSARRDPRPSLVYESRLDKTIVDDRYFCGGYQDGEARLRDFRYVTFPKWWHKFAFWKASDVHLKAR